MNSQADQISKIDKIIDQRIDALIAKRPDLESARYFMRMELLDVYKRTGHVPEIKLFDELEEN